MFSVKFDISFQQRALLLSTPWENELMLHL